MMSIYKERGLMEENELYIFPKLAKKKLNLAKETFQTVYIYGMTGFGKTSLVTHYFAKRNYIYIDARTAMLSEFDNIPVDQADGRKRTVVVVDQLQFAEDGLIRDRILQLFNRKDIWLILVSRAVCPKWMLAHRLKSRDFMEITESDLALSLSEVDRYLKKKDIRLNSEELMMLWQMSRGHGLSLNISVTQIITDSRQRHEPPRYDEYIYDRSKRILWDYVECEIYEKWDPWLTENTMCLSIVDSFDKELAEYITGGACVEMLLEKCVETGNFISIHNGYYCIEPEVRRSMARRLEKSYSREQRNELYFNAGRYYKKKGDYKNTLSMFEKAGNTKGIIEILVETGKSQPGTGYLYELKDYYLAMSEENIKKYVELMGGICMLYSLILDVDKSEYWYSQIEQLSRVEKGNDKKKVKSMLVYLNISLPHRGSNSMVGILKDAWNLAIDRQINLNDLCVTSNAPSNMNGGKDFCEWSKKDKELANSVGRVVSFVLGKQGAGLVELALAESFMEKGGDDYEVIRRISKGLMQAENGKIEQCFVGEGLLAKLHLRKGNIDDARTVLYSFRQKCVDKKAVWLLPNIDNCLCMLNLYSGNSDLYLEWMEKSAPDESQSFFIMERYRYLTKIRIYLIQGKHANALSLIERMLYYARMYDRIYIRMECEILLAILEYRTGNENWTETFQNVYNTAEDYHFVRVLTAEAGAVLELFENMELTVRDRNYYERVIEETRNMAKFYPVYLKEAACEETFNENALQILRYQALGLSNEEIAEKMQISINTVKYHCRENYQKLGVKNRVAAVAEAQKKNLI